MTNSEVISRIRREFKLSVTKLFVLMPRHVSDIHWFSSSRIDGEQRESEPFIFLSWTLSGIVFTYPTIFVEQIDMQKATSLCVYALFCITLIFKINIILLGLFAYLFVSD